MTNNKKTLVQTINDHLANLVNWQKHMGRSEPKWVKSITHYLEVFGSKVNGLHCISFIIIGD